jgi:chemotaxis protein MotB
MQEHPDLRPLMENLVFELTPKGLRIQVIDQQGKPMFASGSAEMLTATRTLMGKLGQSLASLPNPVVITGHTDAVPFSGRANYDNWDLSTDRANATRRVLVGAGVEKERLISVTGKAYTEPLVPTEPEDPSNRRISVLLQYSETASSANTDTPVTRPAGQLSGGSAASQQAMQEDQANTAREDNEMPTQNIAPLLDNATLDSLRSVLR